LADAEPTLARAFTAPVYIVTAASGGRRAGCLVGFATQASMDPERFMVCISRANATYPVAMAAARLAVHAVTEGERGLAELFGGETGDDVDKFARCSWEPADDGTPILSGPPTWFLGRVLERIDLGDHVGCVVEPERWHGGGPIAQLTERDLAEIEPGHPPNLRATGRTSRRPTR
jgi:flavin reductase (DIM6/NTAB) family NADH-FMN oxidoreductase RutF